MPDYSQKIDSSHKSFQNKKLVLRQFIIQYVKTVKETTLSKLLLIFLKLIPSTSRTPNINFPLSLTAFAMLATLIHLSSPLTKTCEPFPCEKIE